MKGSEKMAVYIGTFIFVIVGYLLSLIAAEVLNDVFASLNIPTGIIIAIGWFIVCLLTYWGAARWIEDGEKIGILSLSFFIIWIVSTVAMVISYIINILLLGLTVTINLDLMINSFLGSLTTAIAPAVSALLGVSNKARYSK